MKWGWVWVLAGLVVGVPEAWSQWLPPTEPPRTSVIQNVVMSWDRSAMPGEVELMAPRTLVAYDRDDQAKLYGNLFLTCATATGGGTGRCPVNDTGDNSTGASKVAVSFTEARTGLVTEIAVQGALRRADGSFACSGDLWKPDTQPLHTSYASNCGPRPPAGTSVHLWVPAIEMERLVAGKWSAVLELRLRSPIDDGLGIYRFNFDFTITDHNAVSIYFPQYESATPLINLDARFDPIHQTVGGRVVVDMCLYDGLGSQASFLGVTARHTSARAPGPTGFALWHETPGNADSQRLDYTVTLKHSDVDVPLANGVETELRGIDSARLRLVLLPGMSQPIFCVPTPMTLEMPLVPVSEKQSGVYWGDLKIELRVPTASP